MKKIMLPADIEHYVHKTVAKRIIKCVLLMILFGTILYFWGERMFSFSRELKIGAYIVVMLLPFIISGVPIKLIDRNWCGKVISVEIKSGTAFHTEGNGKGTPYTKNTVYLWVKTESGKLRKIAVKEFGAKLYNGADVPSQGKIEHHTEDYSVGDIVYHFYGLEHYYVVRHNSDTLDCVICGSHNSNESKECFYCGYTLIKL